MLFWLDIDGYRVAVQAVKRGNTAYWRLAPYTIVYPTPRQREVRNTLMVGAHSGVAMSAYAVNKKVQHRMMQYIHLYSWHRISTQTQTTKQY